MKKGFTLIELLVVIAIISLLSSVVLSSLNSARMKARDIKRVSDLKSVDLAMELYRDKFGQWPLTPNTPPSSNANMAADFVTMANTLVTAGFLSSVPRDPGGSGEQYMTYRYNAGSAAGEIIVANLEGIAPTTVGPFNSCRPFYIIAGRDNWCSYTRSSTQYCLCHPY